MPAMKDNPLRRVFLLVNLDTYPDMIEFIWDRVIPVAGIVLGIIPLICSLSRSRKRIRVRHRRFRFGMIEWERRDRDEDTRS
ncbi:hypothetical protein [Labrys sp. 22185]|uniref:hypothetical protein n=1 Tax=Labrys sp. 22185 TaxID=3453888 RepID=UPI003F85E2E8